MSATIDTFRDLQKEAAGSCAECLRDHIAENIAILGDLAGTAQNMEAIRHTSPENQELWEKATAELIAATMIIAVFTAELTKRPAPVATFTLSNN